MLLDSRASSSIAHERLFQKLNTYVDNSTVWNTMAGTLSTSKRGSLNIKMPEFNETATIKIDCHVTTNKSNYDIIIGELGGFILIVELFHVTVSLLKSNVMPNSRRVSLPMIIS